MENNIDFDEMDKEIEPINAYFKGLQRDGMRDILRYFDRIHDKLFSFNNMLIAGYFVIIALPQSSVSAWWIIFPIFNMLYLIYIEYKMMEKSRFEADITNKTPEQINQWRNKINKTTNRSLQTILITLIVVVVFILQLKQII